MLRSRVFEFEIYNENIKASLLDSDFKKKSNNLIQIITKPPPEVWNNVKGDSSEKLHRSTVRGTNL